MENTTEQNQEVTFNLTKTLIVIERDSDLNEMFREKYGTDYKMCHALINSGTGLKPKAEAYIKALFDGVILESERRTKMYLSLGDEAVVDEVVDEVVVEVISDKPNKIQTAFNKKRWGLKAIASDIVDNFKGKDTQIHRTGNKVQELKKIFSRLEMKMFNERFNKETLTEGQLREISGAIDSFNKKVESIIKPKI